MEPKNHDLRIALPCHDHRTGFDFGNPVVTRGRFENQRVIQDNQAEIKSNQDKLDAILRNQDEIKRNQETIIGNQEKLLARG